MKGFLARYEGQLQHSCLWRVTCSFRQETDRYRWMLRLSFWMSLQKSILFFMRMEIMNTE